MTYKSETPKSQKSSYIVKIETHTLGAGGLIITPAAG